MGLFILGFFIGANVGFILLALMKAGGTEPNPEYQITHAFEMYSFGGSTTKILRRRDLIEKLAGCGGKGYRAGAFEWMIMWKQYCFIDWVDQKYEVMVEA